MTKMHWDTQQHPEGPRYEFSYAVFEEFPEIKTNTYKVNEVIVGTQKEKVIQTYKIPCDASKIQSHQRD